MKTKLLTLLVLLVSCVVTAQNAINYKALIKDNVGNVLVSQPVTVQFTILEGSGMTSVYQEDHTTTTDANGIIILNIGEGNLQSGDYSTIDWSTDDHFLNVQIDSGSGLVDLGTTQFMAVPYALYAKTAGNAENVSGLEAIDEGNGIGWRIKDRDPNYYGNIGSFAIDLSFNDELSDVYGAVGPVANAFGRSTTASGTGSTAMGGYTTASGYFSTAMGFLTKAESLLSTAIGRYNVGGGDPSVWVGNDPLFEVGNGTNDLNRSNALTIYKTGYHLIESQVSGLRVNSANTGLIIDNAGATGIYVFGGSNYGLIINDAQQDGLVISDAQDDGMEVSAADEGARIIGGSVGVYASSSAAGNPDIILGGFNDGTNEGDDGIIASAPNISTSDIYLRSNDAIVMELDDDNVTNNNANFIIRNGSDTNVFTVDESGETTVTGILRIGTETIEDTGSNQLSVNASLIPDNDNAMRLGNASNRWVGVWAVDGTINTSDRREKKNINPIDYGLNEVLKMKPVSFNWKNSNDPDLKLGLIAQDLQLVVPEVVKSHTWELDETTNKLVEEPLDRLGVYYSDLIPVLIKAIQEQQDIIAKQDLKIKELTAESNQKDTALQSFDQRLKQVEALVGTNP